VRRPYWSSVENRVSVPADRQELLAQIDIAFAQAVARRCDGASGLGLSLSGGLDARSILACVDPDIARRTLQTVCLGVPGSRDLRSASKLAKIAGCRHHNHVLDDTFLTRFQSHLENMVRLTDGQYLSQCIVMPTLPLYQELGIRYLLRGHAGELMHMRKAYSYSIDEGALQIRTNKQLEEWLFRKLQARMLDGVTTPLFTHQYQQGLTELAAESLREDVAEMAAIEPPLQQIWHLFLMQRLRRETPLSMQKFRSVVEPRLPFLDNDLIPLLLAAPPDLKLDEEIQTYILRKHRPDFLRVTNTNTGTYIGAPAWRRKLSTFQMRVLAKLRVPGYQPYERLGPWLRHELAPMVRGILLDSRTLDRGIFQPDGIRAVVHQHLEKGRNHTYLLMALMIFELGLRRLMDFEHASPLAPQAVA
jgi:asparagine synthase (glutamine-hydrolysing)